MTAALDRILCRIARRYASYRTPYEDLIQEARLAAWKAAQLPNAATTGFVMRAAKWAIFAYVAREHKEAHLSLERDHCHLGAQLTTPDFAPALIEVLAGREPSLPAYSERLERASESADDEAYNAAIRLGLVIPPAIETPVKAS